MLYAYDTRKPEIRWKEKGEARRSSLAMDLLVMIRPPHKSLSFYVELLKFSVLLLLPLLLSVECKQKRGDRSPLLINLFRRTNNTCQSIRLMDMQVQEQSPHSPRHGVKPVQRKHHALSGRQGRVIELLL